MKNISLMTDVLMLFVIFHLFSLQNKISNGVETGESTAEKSLILTFWIKRFYDNSLLKLNNSAKG